MGKCCAKCSRAARVPHKLKGCSGKYKKFHSPGGGNVPNYLHGKEKENTQMIYPRMVSLKH